MADATCFTCGSDVDGVDIEHDLKALRTLIDLTQHDGWQIYLDLLRQDYRKAISELVTQDGDARLQLTRQMKCRELAKRLVFDAGLETTLESLIETGDEHISASRILAAAKEY
jgi:hypothetical protein